MTVLRCLVAGIAAVLLLALVGCGGNGGGAAPPAAPVPPPPPYAAPQATPSPEVGAVITVEMADFALNMDQRMLTPGTYTFRAPNVGQFPHTITINGPGVETVTAGGPAPPGETVELTVTLQQGTYEMWCPVADHRERGMFTTFTVA